MRESGEDLGKVRKRVEKLGKVGKSKEKCGKVAKSGVPCNVPCIVLSSIADTQKTDKQINRQIK